DMIPLDRGAGGRIVVFRFQDGRAVEGAQLIVTVQRDPHPSWSNRDHVILGRMVIQYEQLKPLGHPYVFLEFEIVSASADISIKDVGHRVQAEQHLPVGIYSARRDHVVRERCGTQRIPDRDQSPGLVYGLREVAPALELRGNGELSSGGWHPDA